ncbi:hypothetical protein [Nonomuraea fuscirosea]|uniref:hypothetical protein n=1 Tax=Nonomuraea fuscirosea TaxID=1291556 RepID=UPI00342229F4
MPHRLIDRAARGDRGSFERVRAVSVITPIAIVGVDLGVRAAFASAPGASRRRTAER